MAVTITGPTSLTFPTDSYTLTADYNASQAVTWSVTGVSSNLPSSSYTVSIDSTGLLTISVVPGTTIPSGGVTFNLTVVGRHSPGNSGSLGVTVAGATVPCFVTGTLIATARGEVAVEDLVEGDLIATVDGAYLPLRHVLRQQIPAEKLHADPAARPVRIRKGAFGEAPRRDLLVSPMHRVLLDGWPVELHCGAERVLAHAAHLVDDISIVQEPPETAVTYHHLLLDTHAIVLSEGLATESMFLGEMVALMLPEPDLLAIEAVIGRRLSEAARQHPQTRYRCLTRAEAQLVGRHRGAA